MNLSTANAVVSRSPPRSGRWRRFIFAAVVLATILALFYAVEDWRGRRAWAQRKTELKAKGLDFDWSLYIPPMVPDDQNFFKAPKMTEWFVRAGAGPKGNKIILQMEMPPASDLKPVVAEVTVTNAGTGTETNHGGNVFNLGEAGAAPLKLALAALGPYATGGQGYTFVSRTPEQIKPAHIVLLADKLPSEKELAELFPERALSSSEFGQKTTSGLKVTRTSTNTFQVLLDPAPTDAAGYLAACDKLNGEFDLMREAAKRPYARMEGDYTTPMHVPVPNFVHMRYLMQLLSQRAQCHLILGEPQKALDDLTLMHVLARTLESRPSGKPITLVAAMIDVAITGLYTRTIADGMRLEAWREPQLVALQKQLGELDFSPLLARSLRSAGAFCQHHLETMSAPELARLLAIGQYKNQPDFWRMITDTHFYLFALEPRGWIYQNMVNSADAHALMQDGFGAAAATLNPAKVDELSTRMEGMSKNSPYTYFTTRLIPNYTRATMMMAYQQTMANEAQIVCALERYRDKQGHYPEKLETLTPQYLERIPTDIIGGQALKYHRTDDGKFALYSIGWDEKDEGGISALKGIRGTALLDIEKGDWAWAGLLQ